MRIVTLLPAATEMVASLGLESHLVGRSHECEFPKSITDRPIVTRPLIDDSMSSEEIDELVRRHTNDGAALYEIDRAALQRIRPDLIITQELCDVCAIAPAQVSQAIADLENRPQVLHLSAAKLDDVFDDILRIGRVANCSERATSIVNDLKKRVAAVSADSSKQQRRVLFLEWLSPAFAAGHWNPELIELAGGCNETSIKAGEKSSVITETKLGQLNPELIFVAACGFSAERAEREWEMLASDDPVRQLHVRSRTELVFADGNAYFNRPGPRLVDSLEILADTVRKLS